MQNGSYTTCDPGSQGWLLRAESIEVDRDSGFATARHAQLAIGGVPLLYTPWISFPVGTARKTGLLIPSFGSSDNTGTSMTLPYYLNLAPNYDATLRPRLTSRRGEVLGGRFRYLTEHSTGRIEAELLPEDRLTDESRSLVSFRHRYRMSSGLDSRVEYTRVSDIDYLRDLGTGAAVSTTDHLRRFAEVGYESPYLRFEAQAEDYQLLTPRPRDQDPYRVVPRVGLESRLAERNRHLNFDFRGDVARFDHRTRTVADGTRADLHPSFALPMRSPLGYVVPRATLHYTAYELDPVAGGTSESLSRVLPSFSVDGGLYLSHLTSGGERPFTQTLEPRFHYLRVPYRNQDHLPLFDAGSLTSGYDHMFRENRFSGADRIGDADRLTLALDSRILSGGREVLETRIGTMRHFRDRRVRLCTTADPDSRSSYHCGEEEAFGDTWRSNWIAALKARPHRSVTLGGAIESDGGDSRNRTIALGLRYHTTPDRILNLGYRKFPLATTSVRQVQESVDDVTETVNISARRDLGRNLQLLGSASYALEEDSMTEIYAGFEVDTCCWSARMVGQRYLPGGSTEHENSVMVQFELKGLTGIDTGTDRSRIRPIPGDRNRF